MNERIFVALYLDADVDRKLAEQLRARGFKVTSAREVGNDELLDEAQLAYAVEQGCVLLTHNARHFVPLFKKWWHAGQSHCGIIVSSQLPIGELLRRTLWLLDAVTADEMANNIRNLAEFASRPTEET